MHDEPWVVLTVIRRLAALTGSSSESTDASSLHRHDNWRGEGGKEGGEGGGPRPTVEAA